MKGLTALGIVVGIALAFSLLLVTHPAAARLDASGDGGGGGGDYGGGGGIPLSGVTCTPACKTDEICANGLCYPRYTPPTGSVACSKDADCTKIGTTWKCIVPWGICVNPVEYRKTQSSGLIGACSYTMPKDRDDYSECDDGTEPECISQVYSQAGLDNPCYSSSSVPLLDSYVADPKKKLCIYEVNLTRFDSDDRAGVCAGDCNGGYSIYTDNTRDSSDSKTFNPPYDATSKFLQAGTASIQQWAEDTWIAKNRGETTRKVASAFTVSVLNPTVLQKCALEEGNTKPILAPLCNNTDNSCTFVTGSVPSCKPCSILNGPVGGSTTTSCQGNYKITVMQQTYYTYKCTADKVLANVGAYRACAGAATGSSQTVTDRTLCKYGCANGQCKKGTLPALTSITARPNKVKQNDTIRVTSVATDPDIVNIGGDSGGGGPSGECSSHSPVYTGNVESAIRQVISDDLAAGTGIFDHSDQPYGWPRVLDAIAYEDNVVSVLQSSGLVACADCADYEEISVRRSSDSFDENYDIYTATGYVRGAAYVCWASPPADTAGMAAANPTFDLTGFATADGSTREKIRLECGTSASGNSSSTGQFNFSAICEGGSSSRVKLTWTKPTGAVQNIVKKREYPSGSFSSLYSGADVTYTDTAVQIGKSYEYIYKPDPNIIKRLVMEVSEGACTGASLITGAVTGLPITGMATPGCGLDEDGDPVEGADVHGFNGPVTSIGVKVFHYECADGTSNNNGPIKIGCAVTLDSTAKSDNQPTDSMGTPTWSCTGPFDLGRDTCFNPRGHVTGEGPITCTITLDGVQGSVTFQAGGTGGSEGTVQNITFNVDLCTSPYVEANPNCTITRIPASWSDGGEKTIYCRVRDESGLYSDAKTAKVFVDTQPPVSVITSPEPGSVRTMSFNVGVTDTDDDELDKCYFYATSGNVTTNETLRECNKPITIRIGPGGPCPYHGTCTMSVYAIDKTGNRGDAYERDFDVKLFYTNITFPADGAFITRNFTVEVDDRTLLPNLNMTCTYDIYNVTTARRTKTVSNAPRDCNTPFAVSIGTDGDCNVLGQSACMIVSKVNATIDGTMLSETSERFYSIDWITPISEILNKPTEWKRSDFTLLVADHPQGSVITDCQYKVVSNGVETRHWTSRECGGASGSGVAITVGPNKDCKNEGGNICTIFVRALGRNNELGIQDSVNVSIILNENVTSTDAFSFIGKIATNRGVNFTGTLRNELALASFYVCNASSTVRGCIDAYVSGNRGQDSPDLCGALMTGTTGKCEVRCNDRNLNFYFAAKGQPLTGQPRAVYVVSPIDTVTCPTFRIDEINDYLSTFRELEQAILIEIMMTDEYIQENGETPELQERLQVLHEALLLTQDHIDYMEEAMQNLNTAVAEQIIARSITRLAEISRLLQQITTPTIVDMNVTISSPVRFNASTVLPISIFKSGPSDAYGKVYCSITKPGGVVIRNTTACTEFPDGTDTVINIPFSADRIGTWSYSCSLGRSVRPDCTFEVITTQADGTFQVLPGLPGYIESVSVTPDVIVKHYAQAQALINNPDDITKYFNVSCEFYDPTGFMRRNSSECVEVLSTDTDTASVSMYVGERTGTWRVKNCKLYGTMQSSCSGLGFENISRDEKEFNVTLPTDVFIETVDLPGQVYNGTTSYITASVTNPTDLPAYVEFSCNITNPESNFVLSSRQAIDTEHAAVFNLTIDANVVGTWTVNNCRTSKSPTPDYLLLEETYVMENVGTFPVMQGTKLFFLSKTLPPGAAIGSEATMDFLVKNPSVQRYAQVTCQYRTPLNTPLTASSQCLSVGANTQRTIPVGIFIDRAGTWNIETCTVRGSINSDCTDSSLHDTMQNVGSFSSPGGIGVTSVPVSDLYIQSVSVAANAYNNTRTNAIVTLTNNNSVNTTYAFAGCTFTNPLNGNSRPVSACRQIPPTSSVVVALPQQLSMPGTWTVGDCYVNGSSSSNCAYSLLYNVSTARNDINVVAPNDLYVLSVNTPDNDIANNTNVRVDVSVTNPTADKFGSLTCTVTDPQGNNQTKTAPCVSIPAGNTGQYNFTVTPSITGTWIVSSCAVQSSSSASCGNAVTTGELVNGDTFNVIRGYNLLFTSLTLPPQIYSGSQMTLQYTVSNPATSERFAKVECTATKSGSSITNSTDCFSVPRESFVSYATTLNTNTTGTWGLVCNLERSFDSTCSSPTVDDTATRTFDVVNAPDLYVQSISAPSIVPKDKRFETIIYVRNLALQKLYGFVGCTFKNNLSEAVTNTSTCEDISRDTNSQVISFTPDFRGKWEIYGCYVKASVNGDCSSSRVHNISTERRNFTATVSILTIEGITVTPAEPLIGDLLDIAVSVKNNDERDHGAFVNCTVYNPRGTRYKLTTPLVTLQFGETKTFHAQRTVDVAGTWNVESCSAYRVDSPPILEDQEPINQNITVGVPSPTGLCSPTLPCRSGYTCVDNRCVEQPPGCSLSNCPGIDGACYCTGDACIACGQGYTCANKKCVPTTPINQPCGSTSECPSGQACVSGICTDQVQECYLNSDCASGLECKEGKCTVPSGGLGSDATNLVIIVLSAVSVPIILFIYIRRVI